MSVTTKRGKVGRLALNVFAGFGFVYLFLPIAFIVAFSFNEPVGKFNIIWQNFTLENWEDPFSDQALTDAFVTSLQIAAVSTFIATVLGSMIAILLVLPLTTPEIVLGSSLATLFLGQSVVDFGFTTIVIAHAMFQVSFVALTVRARIRGFDWTLEQAAQDLGASPMRTFWKITFPLILPGILAASLLAFALSLDDFIITFFNAGSTLTFPLRIFGASRVELPPQINVLATVILVVTVAIMAVGSVLGQRRRKRLGQTS
jgi:spermidine/putrescine transport system permease protein